jgi:hypothetical protein
MSKTIEEAAWDYSDSQRMAIEDDRATAYAKGFIAGSDFALAHQWRSVEEELPEIPNGKKMIRVLAWIGDEPLVCWYTCHGRFITTLAAKEKYSYDCMAKVKVHLSSEREDVTEIVTHWIPIPSLPDTNTEKK